VSGFVIQLKVLGGAIVTILAFELEAVKAMIKLDVTVVCLEFHSVSTGR
jgi:hypothetical protein